MYSFVQYQVSTVHFYNPTNLLKKLKKKSIYLCQKSEKFNAFVLYKSTVHQKSELQKYIFETRRRK